MIHIQLLAGTAGIQSAGIVPARVMAAWEGARAIGAGGGAGAGDIDGGAYVGRGAAAVAGCDSGGGPSFSGGRSSSAVCIWQPNSIPPQTSGTAFLSKRYNIANCLGLGVKSGFHLSAAPARFQSGNSAAQAHDWSISAQER